MQGTRRGTLIGRQAESDGLVRRLADGPGRWRGLIYVEAPAGAGKTRLLAFATDSARDEGMVVLQAAGHELERNYPFGIATQLLEESAWRRTPTEAPAAGRCGAFRAPMAHQDWR